MHTGRLNAARSRGFTLIELMIVVVVVGVLSAIAFPSYQQYVRKSNRSSAQQLMLEISSKETQYILDARQYTDIIGSGGLNVANKDGWTCTATNATPQCSNNFYNLAVTVDNTATPPTFSMTATAKNNQIPDGNLTYNNLGAKTRLVGGADQGW